MHQPSLNPRLIFHAESDGAEVAIPAGVDSLEHFRQWAGSDEFPEHGRIDWVAGSLDVDMSPEDLNTHSSPKSAVAIKLGVLLQETRRALVCIDSTRLSSPAANLSAEPDILVLFLTTLESGRARLVPKASGKKDRYVEIEGSPDLAVECVSDASTHKDKRLLRDLYHRAGLREYWIIDARGDAIEFEVLHYRKDGYVAAIPDAAGFQRSEVLERRLRLTRTRSESGIVFFQLEVEA